MGLLSLGFWLYDLLSLFRTPGAHRRLSKQKFIEAIPFVKQDGLAGGFRYYDASMWDDGLAIETLRSAQHLGALAVNYVEGVSALWHEGQVTGFDCRDVEDPSGKTFPIRAHRTILCAGPWTDLVGETISKDWKTWLAPSKGTHLIFDLKRIPIPGAMVMTNPKDGRIAFVIPRPDFGPGIVIVGTTDGSSPRNPEDVEVSTADVEYLMSQLNRYFPDLKLTASEIRSAYVGVRPLFAPGAGGTDTLQKVSREHHIDRGPGGVVVVAGGKYTTARNMGEQIVDFLMRSWREDVRATGHGFYPSGIQEPQTKTAINPASLSVPTQQARDWATKAGLSVPPRLFELYGADALEIAALERRYPRLGPADPEGFPFLEAMFRWSVRREMTMHLEDFFFRRVPIFLALEDHGLAWLPALAQILVQERGLEPVAAQEEVQSVRAEIAKRMAWKSKL
jgi:glycerol-3-phosphate dehydrogenase